MNENKRKNIDTNKKKLLSDVCGRNHLHSDSMIPMRDLILTEVASVAKVKKTRKTKNSAAKKQVNK